jgi:hypothetical protein
MPTLAILRHEWHGLWSSWLVRLWLVATGLLVFLTVATGWETQQTAPLVAALMIPYLIFPWFLVVLMLGIGPVTGSRLDALADGILCRPVTRYEYLLACWAARVVVVLAVFLVTTVPAVLLLAFATNRSAAGEPITWFGATAAISVVGLVLVFLVSLAFLAGTLLRKPFLAAVVLIFAWIPINLILHTFSLEEFSPMSLNQALPTVLKTPWSVDTEEEVASVAAEDMQAMSREAARFISILSGGAPLQEEKPEGFFAQGEYEDFSLLRIYLGYGIPTLIAVALSVLSFAWRDL